jgi:hypothetical protein
MGFKDHHEAFYFLHDLSKKLKFENKLEASEHLNYYLERRGASTATEAMEQMLDGLDEFLVKFPDEVNDLEKKKIKYAMAAYTKGLGGIPMK